MQRVQRAAHTDHVWGRAPVSGVAREQGDRARVVKGPRARARCLGRGSGTGNAASAQCTTSTYTCTTRVAAPAPTCPRCPHDSSKYFPPPCLHLSLAPVLSSCLLLHHRSLLRRLLIQQYDHNITLNIIIIIIIIISIIIISVIISSHTELKIHSSYKLLMMRPFVTGRF